MSLFFATAILSVGTDLEVPGRVVALAVAAALHLPAALLLPWLDALLLSGDAPSDARLGGLATPGPALLGALLWGWKATAGRHARVFHPIDLVLGAAAVVVVLLLPLSLLQQADASTGPLLGGLLGAGLAAWVAAARLGVALLPRDRPPVPRDGAAERTGGPSRAGATAPFALSAILVVLAAHAPASAGIAGAALALAFVVRGRGGPAVLGAHARFAAHALRSRKEAGASPDGDTPPRWVLEAVGEADSPTPPAAVPGILATRLRGAARIGWLVLLPGGPAFVHRSLARTWETRLSGARTLGRTSTPLATHLHLDLDGERFVLLLAHPGGEGVAFDGDGGS